MSPARFVLAVPIDGAETVKIDAPPVIVPSLEGLCSARSKLWVGPETNVIDLGLRGIIIGIVFARNSSVRLETLPPATLTSEGWLRFVEWLTTDCWGAYFAVIGDPRSGKLATYGDPSGLMPVYQRATDRHLLFASGPGLLGKPVTEDAAIVSWSALQSHLAWPDLRQQPTCLAGISELRPGAIVPIGQAGDGSTQIWQAQSFLPNGPPPTFEAAAHALRDLATTTIAAWAGQLGRVAVAASGGVDSSLICAALANGGQDFDCVTLATTDPSGDETAHVRLLGDSLGVRTIAATYALDPIDLLRPASIGLARPSRKSFMNALDRALTAAAAELGAQVVFDGNSGDDLFCFLHSAAPLIDRLRVQGPGAGVVSTFFDLCRLTGCDISTMARAALRRVRHPPAPGLWLPDLRLLAHSPMAPPDPLTPYLNTEVGKHGGKRDHLALIMRGQTHVHDIGSLPRFSPLVSQPLVEFCLRIPTWLWCEGGINRALARAAFAQHLPTAIVARTSKAGPDSFIRKLFDANRQMIREGLLDGLLARHGILDRSATETALAVDAMSGDAIVYRLLDLIEAEAWARSWQP